MQDKSNEPTVKLTTIEDLSRFLKRVSSMGQEMAFWRSKKQSRTLEEGILGLLSTVDDPAFYEGSPESMHRRLEALVHLQNALRRLVVAVPFDKRVSLLHRPLVPCYQQLIILDNLTTAIFHRLQRHSNLKPMPVTPKGSLLGTDAKRAVRAAFREVVPSWDRKGWNLYDTV